MKQIIILILLAVIGCVKVNSSVNDDNIKKLEDKCSELQKQQIQTDKVIFKLSEKQKKDDQQIRVLCDENAKQSAIIDSLQKVCRQLENVQTIDRKEFNGKIFIADSNIRASQNMLNMYIIQMDGIFPKTCTSQQQTTGT